MHSSLSYQSVTFWLTMEQIKPYISGLGLLLGVDNSLGAENQKIDVSSSSSESDSIFSTTESDGTMQKWRPQRRQPSSAAQYSCCRWQIGKEKQECSLFHGWDSIWNYSTCTAFRSSGVSEDLSTLHTCNPRAN